ncbi:MAG TPA: hypothetical protein PKO06_16030 [Candidatus Ozemobacteraceae bacterium]|nr:hypothetical protein [Candidatus Ozemobacteraceae bacterium]
MGYRKERSFVKRRLFRYGLSLIAMMTLALVLAILAHAQDLRTRPSLVTSPSSRLTENEWLIANRTLIRANKTRPDAQALFAEFRHYTGWTREESYARARTFVATTDLTVDDMVDIGVMLLFRADYNPYPVFTEVARTLTPYQPFNR